MALKFEDIKPKSTRAGRGPSIMTEEVVQELKDNPGKWGLVAENSTSAQSVAQWVNKPDNKKAFEYTSVATGKKKKNTKGKEVNTYNVYVCFKP